MQNNFKVGARSTAFLKLEQFFDENRNESKKYHLFKQVVLNKKSFKCWKTKNIDFFSFQKILNTIGKFDLEPMTNIDNLFIHPYQNANVLIDGKIVGYICKLHPSVCEDYDLNDTFIAEIDFEAIKMNYKTNSYSKFQSSKKI